MYKRKIATLVTAAFAGLMLSSPSFSQNDSKNTAADKAQAESQSNSPNTGARDSRTSERANKQSAGSMSTEATAKADYKAAVDKCTSQPVTERGTCMQDAKDAQSLAMKNAPKDSPATSGTPQSRSSDRSGNQSAGSMKAEASANADYKTAVNKCESQPVTERGTCMQDAKDAQSLAMGKSRQGSPATSGTPDSRISGPQSLK